MITVGGHGLTCPDPQDYAAQALYMQSQALTIDAYLAGIAAQVTTSTMRPTAIFTFSSTIFVGPTFADGYASPDVLTYSNIPGATADATITFDTPGTYIYGAYTSLSASGAITAGSYRKVRISAIKDPDSAALETNNTEEVTFETNTGGERVTNKSGFISANIGDVYRLAQYEADNNASSMLVNAGSMIWITRAASNDLIEVA